jgi:hypothetical protein
VLLPLFVGGVLVKVRRLARLHGRAPVSRRRFGIAEPLRRFGCAVVRKRRGTMRSCGAVQRLNGM